MIANPDETNAIDFAGAPNVEKLRPANSSRTHYPATFPARPAPILSVIIPTFNELPNVPVVVERVSAALAGVDWEIIFVDDDSARFRHRPS